jgi:hypothetical protein
LELRSKAPLALKVGIALTIGWLVLLALYLSSSVHTWSALWTLPANNFGDFLAGAFAPVAFLWLAIAVLLQRRELELQREELRHNREALSLQADELRRTVAENAAQAKSLEASKEYARQEVVIRTTESTLHSLSLLACNMWHLLYQLNRSHTEYAKSIANWKRFADGDSQIWFAVLIEGLDNSQIAKRTLQAPFPELANSFESQCRAAEKTLGELGAPLHVLANFDQGLVQGVRSRLHGAGLIAGK